MNSAEVSITVEDVNDEIPRFLPADYEVNMGVDGDKVADAAVVRVLAVDGDASEEFASLRYTLLNKNDSEMPFRIDAFTGQIYQNGSLRGREGLIELK